MGEGGIREIFKHAREQSPCILVLEDVDAMVTDNVRSFFLNEMDGLVRLVVAHLLEIVLSCLAAIRHKMTGF